MKGWCVDEDGIDDIWWEDRWHKLIDDEMTSPQFFPESSDVDEGLI